MSPTNSPLPPPPSPGSAGAGAPRPPAMQEAQRARSKWVVPVVILAFVVGLAAVVAAGGVFGSKSNSTGKSTKVTIAGGSASTVAGANAGASSTAAGSASAATGVAAENQPVTVGAGKELPPLGDNKSADPAVGLTPPTLSGSSFDGSPVTITPGGSPKLVLFVAHWCPHCQREVPKIVDWIATGAAPKGLDIVAVSTGVKSNQSNYPPSAWLSKVGFTKPVLADSAKQDAARAWGLPGYPYFVLLKADGTVAKRFSGEIEMADLTTLITDALVT